MKRKAIWLDKAARPVQWSASVVTRTSVQTLHTTPMASTIRCALSVSVMFCLSASSSAALCAALAAARRSASALASVWSRRSRLFRLSATISSLHFTEQKPGSPDVPTALPHCLHGSVPSLRQLCGDIRLAMAAREQPLLLREPPDDALDPFFPVVCCYGEQQRKSTVFSNKILGDGKLYSQMNFFFS